jgi:hypothetical protein
MCVNYAFNKKVDRTYIIEEIMYVAAFWIISYDLQGE